jgi:hypothetical protein
MVDLSAAPRDQQNSLPLIDVRKGIRFIGMSDKYPSQ